MKRYTFVLLSVFVCFTTIYAQSKSAIEFYDTTGSEPASRIGWTGDKDNGHFFVETPGEDGEIKVQKGNLEVNGTVKAAKFEGDGSGLTSLPCSSNGVTEINIANAVVNEDGELVFELSDGETIEAGVVKGADGAAGINWRGTWDNEKTYKKRDAVFYEGSSYYAADDDPAGVPGTDNSWSIIAKKGDKGEPGSGGTGSGVSVTGASIDEDGKLVLELSDGSEIEAGVVKGTDGVDGKDGEDGKDGTNIENALINTKGELVIKLDDGDSINVGVVKGVDGADGKDGSDGEDGTSVSTATIDKDGKLILKLSDGNQITAGVVKESIKDSLILENENAKVKVVTVSGLDEYYTNINSKRISIGCISRGNMPFSTIDAGNASFSNPYGQNISLGSGGISVGHTVDNRYKVAISYDVIKLNNNENETIINGNSITTDTVKSSKVIVDGEALDVPDYVFENNYKLKSLNEVESFIKKHKHLPEVQSAKEIEKNGMDVVKMNLDLLKKVEELTLYMLEQEKKMNKMELEIKSLKNQK